MEGSLKPDKVKVNLDLAEDYLKKNREIFEDLTDRGMYNVAMDVGTSTFQKALCNPREMFMQLAEKVQENSRLFAELEYMRRGIHPDTVVNTDIKLLVQKILYSSTVASAAQTMNTIRLTGEVPLSQLGAHVPYLGGMAGCPHIQYSRDSAPVCLLFMQLCREVGFRSKPYPSESPTEHEKVPSGCVGIITDHADLDSALDVFLHSNTKYPWSLKRLLVQESIYERIQTALEFKCKLKGISSPTPFQNFCAKEFSYDEKIFLVDFFDDKSLTDSPNIILMEAYRTNKELLSLVNEIKLPYVSLWSNDISEANEIAFKTNARAIWINDYAQFDGPSEISGVYYDNLNISKKEKHKVLEDWLKLSQKTRTIKIRECLLTFADTEHMSTDRLLREFISKVLRNIVSQSSVKTSYTNGSLCVVDHKPVGMLTVDYSDLDSIVEAIACMKNGSGINYVTNHFAKEITIDSKKLFKIMEEKHLPVSGDTENESPLPTPWDYETKAVWTNFGTIFAN